MLRTPSRDDDRVRNEIGVAADQIASDRRNPLERAPRGGHVARQRLSRADIVEELRKRLLARSQDDHVRVRRGLIWQRRHMQPAKRDQYAFAPVSVGQRIRSPRVRDVNLDDNEVWMIVGANALDVLIDDDRVVIVPQVGSEGGEPERRKQRVLDRAPERTGGFSQRWQDELHAKAAVWHL